MNINKIIIIFILISVGFLPTGIFLYAQNNNNQLILADRLLNENKIDSLDLVVPNILKDTITLKPAEKANLYYLLGRYNDKKNEAGLALEYFKKAEKLYANFNNLEKLADIQYAKFLLLQFRENLDVNKQATVYLNKYYQYAIKNNDNNRLIKAYIGYASLNFNPTNYKKSIKNFDKAIIVCNMVNDTFALAKINNNKGIIVSNFYHKQDSARIFYKKALKLFLLLKENEIAFSVTLNIGTSYRNENNHKEALRYFYQADTIPIVVHKNNSKKMLYTLMSNSYENTQNYKKAHFYLTKYLAYKDSVDVKAQNIAISDIETKYQTEKKEKENIQLLADKKKQQLYLVITGIVFSTILIVGILGFANLRRKREILKKEKEIEHQKLVSLVKKQELKTMDAMLEGQEKERKRIAEDLHDNLGSKLAVLSLQFDNYIEIANRKGDIKQLKLLENSNTLLDETYNAVRSMAHEEHSNSFANLNLLESVQALAISITNTNKTEIQVIDFGLEEPISAAIEIAIFRIIQELVTNIVKHANAEKATIDLTLFDNEFSIIISDDGNGYETKKLSLGLGLQTVKERVERLQGAFVVDSSIGKGTTIIIEIPLHKNL